MKLDYDDQTGSKQIHDASLNVLPDLLSCTASFDRTNILEKSQRHEQTLASISSTTTTAVTATKAKYDHWLDFPRS